MTSIKVKFRPSTLAGSEGSIYYQITHNRVVRQLATEYRISLSEWDGLRSMVAVGQRGERGRAVNAVRERIKRDVERLTMIDRKLYAAAMPYTADDVVAEFNRYVSEYTLSNFMQGLIDKLQHNGKIRTSETYKATLSSFRKFLASRAPGDTGASCDDIMLDCLTSELMESYEAWHHTRGVVPNTISFYTRILRAVYNRAVEDDIIKNRNPFRHVYTGVDKTVKRALPLPVISKIKGLELSLTPALDFSRDMFLMSFYLRGMSFIDMAYLRKSDLKNGCITYRRRKTGQHLIIGWTKEMQAILDKYPENESDYLLPIIKGRVEDERCVYRNVGYNINHNLKRIAGIAGITIPLTLYVARHSWASAAQAKGVPLSVISEGMGHDSETTTQIYLASIEASVVDQANALILSSL